MMKKLLYHGGDKALLVKAYSFPTLEQIAISGRGFIWLKARKPQKNG